MPDKIYHVYNHDNADDNLLPVDDNYRYFLAKYRDYVNPLADTYAYCLPNHFHFPLKVKAESSLIMHRSGSINTRS